MSCALDYLTFDTVGAFNEGLTVARTTWLIPLRPFPNRMTAIRIFIPQMHNILFYLRFYFIQLNKYEFVL